MNVLALCAGIGGLELGVKIANTAARCVCYVEGEAYAAAILVKRMGEGWLDKAPVWSDVRTFDGLPWRGKVDCITAGYPCQPFSLAGPMLGEQDQRHLFPHIRRIISEVKPGLCFFENVSNHLRMGFQRVHDDLRGMGYRVAAGLFTAEEVGATHKRERLFILGISGSRRWDQKLHELVTMDQSCEKDKGKYKVSYPKGWGSMADSRPAEAANRKGKSLPCPDFDKLPMAMAVPAHQAVDSLLRKHGFTIARRPRDGPPVWVRSGRYFSQEMAERIVAREMERALRGGTEV
jgi:site-specific DNA-cytosine methylase